MRTSQWIAACLAVIATTLCATTLAAATRTWTGTVNANWSTAGNWSGGVAPVAGDDLVFPASGANQTNTNDFPAATSFNSLTFSDGAYFLNGNAITLRAGGITTSGGANHVINLPITLGASQTWGLGTGTSSTDLAATNLNGMDLTIVNSGNVANNWAGVISGTGTITLNDSPGINSYGANTTTAPFIINSSALFVDVAYPGPITVNNFGALGIGAGATVGQVTVNDGFFFPGSAFTNGVANTGSVTLVGATGFFASVNSLSDFSQANVTGTVTLGGSRLILGTGPTAVATGTTFTIINNDGSDPIVGTFLGMPEGGERHVHSLRERRNATELYDQLRRRDGK